MYTHSLPWLPVARQHSSYWVQHDMKTQDMAQAAAGGQQGQRGGSQAEGA